MSPVSLLWFQVGDLRLADNPALCAAARDGSVVPFFAWTSDDDGGWQPGGASRWWLHQSLQELDRSLRQRGSRLVLRTGAAVSGILRDLVAETGATTLFFNRGYTPGERRHAVTLEMHGLAVESFNARLLVEPGDVRPASEPFRVFSAFWRAAAPLIGGYALLPAPDRVGRPAHWPASAPLEALGLQPVPDWAGGLRATWRPGEAGAMRAVRQFLDDSLGKYSLDRDFPDRDGTSRLSPHLHFGEIGPRQVWSGVEARLADAGPKVQLKRSADVLRRELGWRDFAAQLLYGLPHLADRSLDPTFDAVDWRSAPDDLRAWQQGRTGYPLVDAGMRQLWQTGWMHNRVRMLVASFLVKDLLLPWQAGVLWFWDTLVDADLANNTVNWQWAAGSGADAAPFT
ncbi:MAG: deoxyribodipyrimidine photo-lyase, partial [Chloroflexi bacterium]|nr:deoxyribodipyrimidine photo-lyase [Chloroflexota bacterium]